jgi:hypothetical protein
MAVDVSSFFDINVAPRLCCANVPQCCASGLLLCSAPATRYRLACAVTAHAPLLFICCRCQLRLLFQRSSAVRCCLAAASCFGPPFMFGTHYSLLLCACSDCTCTSLCHKPSMTAPSSISARLLAYTLFAHASRFPMAVEVSSFFYVSAAPQLYCSDVQQRHASGLFYAQRPLGTYSRLLCVCSSCICTSLFRQLSISSRSSISARLFGCTALMCSSVRASGLLLCSTPATRSCCAYAVTAHAPLCFISYRYQPRLLSQRAFSAALL